MKKNLYLPLAIIALAATAPALSQNAPQAVPKATYVGKIMQRFDAIDSNKDGFLSQAEIAAAETQTRQQIEAQLLARRKEAFQKADTNKDGSLSFAEFAAATPSPAMQTDGKDVIGKLDSNKDGKVSKAEFQAQALQTFSRLDTNKDGVVSVEEQRRANSR